MGRGKKRPATMAQAMRLLLEQKDIQIPEDCDAREQILLGLIEKAKGGDLKTVEFILKLIGEAPEGKGEVREGVRIELGPGVIEMAE